MSFKAVEYHGTDVTKYLYIWTCKTDNYKLDFFHNMMSINTNFLPEKSPKHLRNPKISKNIENMDGQATLASE